MKIVSHAKDRLFQRVKLHYKEKERLLVELKSYVETNSLVFYEHYGKSVYVIFYKDEELNYVAACLKNRVITIVVWKNKKLERKIKEGHIILDMVEDA